MTCGRRSRRGWLPLACLLLLLSAFSWAGDLEYDGPELPSGWYPIHETELSALETTLTEQAQTLEQQRQTLNRLYGTIERQQMTIERLSKSFETFEREARRRAIKWTIGGVAAGTIIGFVVGLLVN